MGRAKRAVSRWWPAAALVLAALGALGLLIADEMVEAQPAPSGDVAEVPAVDRGVRYCPVTAGDDESATLVLASGAEPAEATVVRYGPGGPTPDEPRSLAAGERVEVALDGEDARGPVSVDWQGGAVAASWHVEGDRDAGAPCLAAPAPTWHLVGIDTALGAEARLHLFNPFSVDAVVRVRFGTPEGRVDLARTANVVVPAEGTEVLDLVDVQPEETELGITVETLAGRVIASAEIDRSRIDEEDEGPEGRTIVPAVDAPAQAWHLPTAIVGDAWESDVVVYNPGDREAAVAIRTSDPLEDVARAEHSIPPGSTTRIDLTDRAATDAFAVVVETVTDVPVVVVRTETFLESDRTGHTVQPAVTSAAPTWVVAGGPGDRDEQVAVHNPGGDPVEVNISAGGQPVPEWQGRVLEANERDTFALDDVDGTARPVVIEGNGDVSAALVSNLADGDDFGRLLGLAFDPAAGDLTVDGPLTVRQDRLLATEPVRPPAVGTGEPGIDEPEADDDPEPDDPEPDGPEPDDAEPDDEPPDDPEPDEVG